MKPRYLMRFRYRELGGHTHVDVFTGRLGMTLGKAGELVFTNEEFQDLLHDQIAMEFVDEDVRQAAKNKA
jgi:hypothetical protein